MTVLFWKSQINGFSIRLQAIQGFIIILAINLDQLRKRRI